ncbi:MAG TPA: hypothetical protein VFP27_09380 [Mycobacterium sp.]|nr:hypothetical protein [Mycobacterium sp.]
MGNGRRRVLGPTMATLAEVDFMPGGYIRPDDASRSRLHRRRRPVTVHQGTTPRCSRLLRKRACAARRCWRWESGTKTVRRD